MHIEKPPRAANHMLKLNTKIFN